MPRAEPTPYSELFARLRERLLVLPNATPNEAAIWNSKALEIVGSIEEQLEAQERMLKAYVERFGLILPTDEPRAEVLFPASEPVEKCPECGNPAVTLFDDGRRMCMDNGHIWQTSNQESRSADES